VALEDRGKITGTFGLKMTKNGYRLDLASAPGWLTGGLLATALIPALCNAADIVVVGLFIGRAVITVDGGRPRTLSAGQRSPEGVKLIAADSQGADIEYEGQRKRLLIGAGSKIGGSSGSSAASGSITLAADAGGHYQANGSINGNTVRFLVDTGATSVAISSTQARALGINYLNGQRGYTETANGRALAYRVRFDTVSIGGITLHQVDGIVLEGDALKIALLGMSFLSRTDMKREGQTLTLVKRF
jgi:aspartyl protease family protein